MTWVIALALTVVLVVLSLIDTIRESKNAKRIARIERKLGIEVERERRVKK